MVKLARSVHPLNFVSGLALFFYAIEQRLSFDALVTPIFGILACYGITHAVFCMWK